MKLFKLGNWSCPLCGEGKFLIGGAKPDIKCYLADHGGETAVCKKCVENRREEIEKIKIFTVPLHIAEGLLIRKGKEKITLRSPKEIFRNLFTLLPLSKVFYLFFRKDVLGKEISITKEIYLGVSDDGKLEIVQKPKPEDGVELREEVGLSITVIGISPRDRVS